MRFCRALLLFVLLFAVLLTALVHAFSQELLRYVVVYLLQNKAAFGALRSSPVRLEEASWRAGTLELRNLRIENVPSKTEWTVPYALHLDRLALHVGSLVNMLSLLQQPIAAAYDSSCILRLGELELLLGFRACHRSSRAACTLCAHGLLFLTHGRAFCQACVPSRRSRCRGSR